MINFPAGTILVGKVDSNNNFVEDALGCDDIYAVSLSGNQTISGNKTLDGQTNIGSISGSYMHTFNGYARENSPTITLLPSGNQTVDCSLYSTTRKTGGTATITLSGMVENQTVSLVLESTGSAYTLTFSGGTFRWPSGTLPTPSAAASVYDVYQFVKINNIIYGNALLNMY